jgi:hypothetical protein
MQRGWVVGAVLAALVVGCTSEGVGHGISISPPPPPGASPTPTGSVSPSASESPGPESPLTSGVATMTVSGDVSLELFFGSLDTPAVWAPPPAPMELVWRDDADQELRLSGTSFVSLSQTSADRVLSFTINGPNAPLTFTSDDGTCDVTITPALPDNMGGVFTCTLLEDAEGSVSVNASGTFTATA